MKAFASAGLGDEYTIFNDGSRPFSALNPERIEECLETLGEEVSSLSWPVSIDYLDELPSPLQFYRDYVSQGRPCIIRNALESWPALQNWTTEYLTAACGDAPISVDVTPSGHGDCLYKIGGEYYFVQPEQRKTSLGEALKFISPLSQDPEQDGVYYVQKQNDSFRLEYAALWADVPNNIEEWGRTVFGTDVDAVNWWCGPDEAVSAMHKDPYDNLYCVVKGSKLFTLLPQSAYPYLHTTFGTPAHFVFESKREVDLINSFEVADSPKWTIEKDKEAGDMKVPWIAVDVDNLGSVARHPRAHKLQPAPLHVLVKAGEMLYLPSLVFHKVAQRRGEDEFTIAVNYWFDMKHDMRYCYLQFLEKMFPPLNSFGNAES